MCPISNTARSNCKNNFGYENTNSSSNSKNALIDKANSSSLEEIFKSYKIQLDSYNKKTVCPFKLHKNGRESSPSFVFYPESNSFYCFGCKSGTKPVDFVSLLLSISKKEAADIILSNNFSLLEREEEESFNDRLNLIIDFSLFIQSIMKINKEKAEELSNAFDKIYDKHKLSNKAIEKIIKSLKGKVY